jgi:hypothetical protein
VSVPDPGETVQDEEMVAFARALQRSHGMAWAGQTVRDVTPTPDGATRDTSHDDVDELAGAAPRPAAGHGLPDLPPGPGGERYAVEGLLGRGGGGLVYLAHDRHFRRAVALKVLHPRHAGDPQRQERLVAEARITAGLEHPNILPLHDLDRGEDGRVYFTMRRAGGRPLHDLIAAMAEGGAAVEAIAGIDERIDLLAKVCDAVAYAHSRGVVHRDIKPANILVGSFGEVLLVDWGTAARRDEIGREKQRLVGTPLYMAPEQARREPADERSDVYALGATLYEMLALRPHLRIAASVEEFWERKRSGAIDPLPESVPEALRAVVLRAMDPDPRRRHDGAAGLRADLAGFQRHQHAIAACAQAEQRLAAAGDHRDHSRAVEEFRHALSLWPENRAARDGLGRAVLAQARYALGHGDLDLAISLLDPSDPVQAPFMEQALAARGRRERIQARARRLRWTLAAAALLLALGVAGFVADRFSRIGAWRPVFERDFAAGAGTGDLTQFKRSPTMRMAVAPAADGGILLEGGWILWLDGVVERGDVRISADVRWSGRIDSVEMMFHAEKGDLPEFWMVPRGYSCQFADHGGLRSYISVNRAPGMPNTTFSTACGFTLDRTYRLTVECRAGVLRMLVDGAEILRREEPLPLVDSALGGVALRTWGPSRISRVVVERLGLPATASPVVAGDALASAGHLGEALRAYRAIADDHRGTAVGEEALAKAFHAACLASSPAREREDLLRRLAADHPGSRRLLGCRAAESLLQWRVGNPSVALAAAEDVLAVEPGSRIALEFLAQCPERVDPAVLPRFLALLGRTRGVSMLDLTGLGISDLSPLRSLPLAWLRLGGNPLRGIGPLAGMPLRDLALDGTGVTDLAPLAGAPLTSLSLNDTAITDLSPLADTPLASLRANRTPIADLSPLRRTRLANLEAGDSRIADLRPLAGLPLTRLHLPHARVESLDGLRGLPLREVMLDENAVADLSPLAGAPLRKLSLRRNRIVDLAPLAGTTASDLALDDNRVSDLRPLRGGSFGELSLNGNPLSDVGPLAECGIGSLALGGTTVGELSSLAGRTFRNLDVRSTALTSLAGMREMTVTGKLYLPRNLPAAEYEGLAAAWESSGRPAALVQRVREAAVIASGDPRRMRAVAARIGDHRMLDLQASTSYSQACAMVAALGAHLPCIRDSATNDAIQTIVPERGYWLGLVDDGAGGWRWADGSPVVFDRRSASQDHSADGERGWYDVRSTGMLFSWFRIPASGVGFGAETIAEWDVSPGEE